MSLDYHAITEALYNLISGADYSAITPTMNHFMEGMGTELLVHNMPYTNVRLVSSENSINSLPNEYYEWVKFEIDIAALDFTYFKTAASLRDSVLRVVRDVVLANTSFHASIYTSKIGPLTSFTASEVEGGNGHVAVARLTVIAEAYV